MLFDLTGLSGFLPIHPLTYMKAWKSRKQALKIEAESREENKSLNSDDNQSANYDENKSEDPEENKSGNSNTNTETPS